MVLSIEKQEILHQLERQLRSFFIVTTDDINVLETSFDAVLNRCEYCFAQTPNKYYHHQNGDAFFNPYVSTQYMIFLYYFSNTIYRVNAEYSALCDKIYYLNKIMNGVDVYYAVELPDHFMVEHPVGSVMGRARYGEGFMFYQNCSVGGIHLPENKIVYPVIGDNVKLFAGSMILGNCKIGNNVNISAGALVKNQDIPSNMNVFGISPNLIIKQRK